MIGTKICRAVADLAVVAWGRGGRREFAEGRQIYKFSQLGLIVIRRERQTESKI